MKKTVLLLLFLCFFSCKEAVVSKIDKDFDDNQWMQKDVRTFEFEIKRDIKSAEVLLNFSHINDPGYSRVPVIVSMQNISDGSAANSTAINLLLKDEQGNFLSDCSGDICDFSYTLQEEGPLKKGNYVVKMQNQYQWEYLPNTLAVGITVRKND